jgi:hypothetical protein
LVLLFSFLTEVIAVTVAIKNHPQEVSKEEFEVNVYIEGAKDGTNYLRVDIFKEGTTNYFGETFNSSTWYSGSDGFSYFPIEIPKESSVSATLKAKVGNPSYSKYPGPGDYLMRVRRYTASGNTSSDTQDPVKVKINLPVNTPTPEVKSESTQEEQTNPATPTPTPTPVATKKSTPRPTVLYTPKPASEEKKVLAIEDEQQSEDNEQVDEEKDVKKPKKSLPLASIFLLVVGALMISYGGYYVFREIWVKYKKKNEKEKT